MEFGKRLRLILQEKDVSQKELAAKIGKDDQTISRWITGKTYPDAFDINNIAKELKINPAELFGVAPQKISPEILEAIQDPIAVEALLVTFKNSQDIKNTIRFFLDCFPALPPEKKQAILPVCKYKLDIMSNHREKRIGLI